MPSTQQMSFHRFMMRQLRNCLKNGTVDGGNDSQRALRYAERLVAERQLRENIAAGLQGDFSIDTDMKYIERFLALAEKKENLGANPEELQPPSEAEFEMARKLAEETDEFERSKEAYYRESLCEDDDDSDGPDMSDVQLPPIKPGEVQLF